MESSVTISVGAMRCRCCLAPGAAAKDLSSEYDWMGEKEVYADMLLESFDVRLKRIENAGWTICDTCITRLRDSTNFKKQVLYSEKTLLQGLTCDSSKPDISSDSKSENVKTEALSDDDDADHFEVQYLEEDIDLDENIKDISVKMEPLASTSEMSNDEDVPLSSLTNNAKRKVSSRINVSQIKSVGSISKLKQKAQAQVQAAKLKAQLQAQAKLRTQQLQAKLQAMKSQVKIKPPPGASKFVMNKMGQIKIVPKSGSAPMIKTGSQMPVLKKPVKITVKPGTETSTLKKITAKPPAKKGRRVRNKPGTLRETEMIRSNWAVLIENSTVLPFRWWRNVFRCFYCYDEFKDQTDLRTHTLTHDHTTIWEVVEKKRRERAPIKLDVSSIMCRLCCAFFFNLDEIKKHLVETHHKVFFDQVPDDAFPFKLDGNFECQVCFEVNFYSFYTLLRHTSEHLAMYVCDICAAPFDSVCKLVAHSKLHAVGKIFRCKHCQEEFPSLNSKLCHVKKFHRVSHKCPLCNKILKDTWAKRSHLIVKHEMKELLVHCDQCGKQFHRRSQLYKHLREKCFKKED